ncbi:MAG: RNA methyltransferase [Tannerellaceae bacterium]|jgi:TrmH family RNA methyltransferase|nr:RNA methyltransferase [Tannerellaceae bacterium]
MIPTATIRYLREMGRRERGADEGLFLAEGPRLVGDLLGRIPATLVMGTAEWYAAQGCTVEADTVLTATDSEIRRSSRLQNPRDVIAVFRRPVWHIGEAEQALIAGAWILSLDGVQDPGNVGAIVRTASWFGIQHIVCSEDTADIFNPKTLQASMGGILNVAVHYCPLAEWLHRMQQQGITVYGTSPHGESLFAADTFDTVGGLVLLGNEGVGIRPDIAAGITRWISIPCYGTAGVESLNVAIAAAILTATIRSPRLSIARQ